MRRLSLFVITLAAACDRPARPAEIGPADSVPAAVTPPPLDGPPVALDQAAAAIRAGVANGRASGLDRPDIQSQRVELGRLYDEGWAPLWVDEAGRPTQAARDAIAAMQTALEDGLDTLDYSAGRLDSVTTVLDTIRPRNPAAVGRFDLAVSVAFLRYLGDLHSGRVDPRAIGFKLDVPLDRHDVPALVRSALSDGSIPQVVLSQPPSLPIYSRVKDALAEYRALADSPTVAVPAVSGSIKPGDAWSGLGALHARLRLLGDLPDSAGATGDSVRYEGALVEAVKRFQDRHGLDPDGVLGKGTVAALNVPISGRVRQLRLTLERLRWIPDLGGERFIVVNIPTYHLWAWDSLSSSGSPSIDMNVIVGQNTLDTQTPVFAEQMRYIIFRPYWNVPPSILRREVLPALRKNADDYLTRNDMEVVQGQGDDARPVAATPENILLLGRGQFRVRQRPGPRNSLGLVKFMFPNDENVYLHSTPAQELFSRTRRDFSHGCVRVERPADLAAWVLMDLPDWDLEHIKTAMESGKSTRVNLPRPLPVILFYTTAIVGIDGRAQFFEDVYGHDERLEKALTTR